MAGHSKWANIRHRKGRQDVLRGKLNTKLIREITVAAKEGGADASSNPRLRLALEKANKANVTKDSIKRAIDKGTGVLEGDNYQEVVYEGYGPNGIAVMVFCLTDNKNRTVAEVRHAFSKYGGNLGTSGSVDYLFARKGVIHCCEVAEEEALMDCALEAGCEDVFAVDTDYYVVQTLPEDFDTVLQALQDKGYQCDKAELSWVADNTIALDAEQTEKLLTLQDALEDLDDTQSVYTNAECAE